LQGKDISKDRNDDIRNKESSSEEIVMSQEENLPEKIDANLLPEKSSSPLADVDMCN